MVKIIAGIFIAALYIFKEEIRGTVLVLSGLGILAGIAYLLGGHCV